MMQRIKWKDTSMKSRRRIRLRFPLEALGTHGVRFMVLVASLVRLVFCDLLHLICGLDYVQCMAMALYCGIVLLLVFFLFVSFSRLLCFKGFGNLFGKEEI